MKKPLAGKSVLVTGASGSFGRAFVRRTLKVHEPSRLVVFSRDELKQWEMQQDPLIGQDSRVRFFIGDVRDADRLDLAMRRIDIVIHAAALKQVTTAEYNPFECVHTNILGAENVVRAALRNSVERVIALSTDKASSPVNLYGASKLASDKIMTAANNLAGDRGTRFAVVRYGNVIGSRGSVIPLFTRLAAEGAKSIPITDPRMTRFWITLEQGVEFVVRCLGQLRGGEIFVPKIPSMKITDVAEALAPGIPLEIVGVRPGEKLHEVMITEDDSRNTFDCGDHYVVEPSFPFWDRQRDLIPNAKPVAETFRYSSDCNSAWLSPNDLIAMLKTADAARN
jgi:UDP-N-acetylglucosamine 4,6-dehydratase